MRHRRGGGVRDAVEESPLVEAAVGPSFTAPSIVRHHDDQGVVDLLRLLEVVEDLAEAIVVVGDVAGKDLRHPREEPLLIGAERVPRANRVELRPCLAIRSGPPGLAVGIDRTQLGAFRQQPELDLARQDSGPDGLISLIEDALVLVRPLERDEVRRVAGLGCQVHEEGLVRIDGLRIANELDRLRRHVVS